MIGGTIVQDPPVRNDRPKEAPRMFAASTRPVRLLAAALTALALAGCGGPASGTGKPSPSKGTSSHAVFVHMPFNTVAFLAPGKKGPNPGFSTFGDLDNATAPHPGPYATHAGKAKVTFRFPSTGSTAKDSLALSYGQKVRLAVHPGKYRHLYLLAGVAGGPQPAMAVLHYKDGTTTPVPVAFDDWCTVEIAHAPVAGTYSAWQGKALVGEASGKLFPVAHNGYHGKAQRCGLYVSVVAINPAHTLTAVGIDNTLTSVPQGLSGITQVQTRAPAGRINLVAATLH